MKILCLHTLMTASVLALSACSSSSSGSGAGSSPVIPPALPDTETMPTTGSASYSGPVSWRGDGDSDSFNYDGTMSLQASFNDGGGVLSGGALNNVTVRTGTGNATGTGSFTQESDVNFSGNDFENLALTGSIDFTLGGNSGTITSGGANTMLVGGTFEGETAQQMEIGIGGATTNFDGEQFLITGEGRLLEQPH